MLSLVSLAGAAAGTSGIVMALSPLLQARRVQIMRESSEVSAGVFLVMRVNSVLWILYGLASGDVVLVVPNAVGFLTTTVTLLVLRRYRHPVVVAAGDSVGGR